MVVRNQSQASLVMSYKSMTLTHHRGSVRNRYMVQLIPVAVVSLCLMCCASLDASNAIDASAKALLAAENQGAAEYARYKYTKAELLLTAAKIRNGHGDFQIAQEWAGKAQLLASDAEQTARSRKTSKSKKTASNVQQSEVKRLRPKTSLRS